MCVVAASSVRSGSGERGAQRSPLSSRLVLAAVLSMVAVVALGCSSSGTKTTTTTAPTSPTAATTPTTAAEVSTTVAASADLSGTWSGQYSGIYSGTFTLTWQQSGSTLTGSIKLSSPALTLGIKGTVQGSTISFGAVGTVTYSGSVSGKSMSGTYQTVAGSSGSGSWSATKSS